ncbi:MAG TPA: sigma-70 family RNA polymerase sigma factor [Pirellulaceae bacterium]|nr:sigma-70 family RNA polymerase sigma factor [Pirellulaceae bacterium]
MPDIDESQLIDASLQGNSAAFGQLVHIHQNRLFNAMAHFCGNATEAEDVVQEAFVQAYLKLAKFQRNSQFYTWLYRIAFNTAISRKRRKRVEASVDKHREDTGLEPVDTGDAPGDQMIREEQAAQVHQALATLSEEHRSILVLREMDGCDYEQIAEILDINVGTVRSRLHRARMQLKERLQELG